MTSTPSRLRQIVRGLLYVLAVVVLGWMFWIGREVPYSEQRGIYSVLRTVAGTMFAVFGLWIGLLYPELRKKVFGRRQTTSQLVIESSGSQDSASVDRQADHLLEPFFMSLFILLATFVVDVAGPILTRVDWLVANKEVFRGLSYSFIGLLALLQVLTILGAMKITEGLKSTISRGGKHKKIRDRIRQNKGDHSG